MDSTTHTLTKPQIQALAREARTLLEQARIVIAADLERALRRVADVEAWAKGGPVPELALRYTGASDALTIGCNGCGDCASCAAAIRDVAEVQSCLAVCDVALPLMRLAATGGADGVDADHVRRFMRSDLESSLSADACERVEAAVDAAIATRAA